MPSIGDYYLKRRHPIREPELARLRYAMGPHQNACSANRLLSL